MSAISARIMGCTFRHFGDAIFSKKFCTFLQKAVAKNKHIDHNIDMRLLDDLIYNQRRFGDTTRKIRWYVDAVTYKVMQVFRAYDSGFKEKCCEIYPMTPIPGSEEFDFGIDLNPEKANSIRMKVFKTTHCYREIEAEDKKKEKEFFNHSFGIELYLTDGQPDYNIERKIFPPVRFKSQYIIPMLPLCRSSLLKA